VEDLDRHDGGFPDVPVSRAALALIQFSSGATADPKPVALSHAQVLAQLAALEKVLPTVERFPQLGVSWLPLYHDMGLIGCLLLAVYVPGPLVLIPPESFLARPALWLRAISRHHATVSAAPSFAYAHCARRVRDEELQGVNLASWRMALCGAEPISVEALRGFATRFGPFGFDAGALRCAYGLAEATLAVTIAPASSGVRALEIDEAELARRSRAVPGARLLASVGSPLPGLEVEVRLPDGKPAGQREVGRVFARGPSVMTGYLGQPQATARVLAGDWLDTGDLGFIDGGELYVCGREKDLIIIRGANHGPEEFEAAVLSLEGNHPSCVVAQGFVPAGEDAEQLLLLVERGSDASPEVDEDVKVGAIRQAVLERTGIRPHTVILLEEGTLPRTASGKPRRGEALRRFLSGELKPPPHAGAVRLSLEVLRSALAFARVRLAGED
jgi:acyl-CoA synthetase (AMP-forming)/AMP-acid ligase II